MTNRSRIVVDFVIVTALERLVSEEVDSRIMYAALLRFVLEVLETIRLVPPCREDIEGNLTTD
jgi:hypothetical protein